MPTYRLALKRRQRTPNSRSAIRSSRARPCGTITYSNFEPFPPMGSNHYALPNRCSSVTRLPAFPIHAYRPVLGVRNAGWLIDVIGYGSRRHGLSRRDDERSVVVSRRPAAGVALPAAGISSAAEPQRSVAWRHATCRVGSRRRGHAVGGADRHGAGGAVRHFPRRPVPLDGS